MVNHYTASKRLRHDDAYTPDGKAGARPDYAVTVYTKILKELYPDVPVIIGGIEASLRRLTHYDYWKDCLMPSILVTSGADYLCYGMGERPMLALTKGIENGWNRHRMEAIPQIAVFKTGAWKEKEGVLVLHGFEECQRDKYKFAENFHWIETHANLMHPDTIIEPVGDGYVDPCEPDASRYDHRAGGGWVCADQSALSDGDDRGDGFVLGPAVHKAAASAVQGKADSRI